MIETDAQAGEVRIPLTGGGAAAGVFVAAYFVTAALAIGALLAGLSSWWITAAVLGLAAVGIGLTARTLLNSPALRPMLIVTRGAPPGYRIVSKGQVSAEGPFDPAGLIVMKTDFLGGYMQSKERWLVVFAAPEVAEWEGALAADRGEGLFKAAEIGMHIEREHADAMRAEIMTALG